MVMTCAVIGGKIHADNHFVPGDNVPDTLEITSHTYDLHKITDGAEGLNLPYGENTKYRDLLSYDVTAMNTAFAGQFPAVSTVLVYPHGSYSDVSDRLLRELGYEVTVSVDYGMATITRGDADSLLHLPRLGVYEDIDGDALLHAIRRAAN
jgi:peptidoglycan/xylan/chitin deacetylase (PgdA/CDA1 family)